jgi:hypothetical protein
MFYPLLLDLFFWRQVHTLSLYDKKGFGAKSVAESESIKCRRK